MPQLCHTNQDPSVFGGISPVVPQFLWGTTLGNTPESSTNTPPVTAAEVQYDKTEVLGGKGFVYRRKEGGSFYLYCWVKEEKKRLRKSLETDDLEVAVRLAESELLRVLARTQVGQRVFSSTLEEVVDAWTELQHKRFRAGELRSLDWAQDKSRWFRKHLGQVFGLDTRIGDLTQADWDRFVEHRRGTVKNDTLSRELSYTKMLVRSVGLRKGADFVPEFEVRAKRGGRSRRTTTFTQDEFRAYRRGVHSYPVPENKDGTFRRDWKVGGDKATKTESKAPGRLDQTLELSRRVLLRYLFEVLAFSGCRPHEVAGSEEHPRESALRWRDVVFLDKQVTGTHLNKTPTSHHLAVLRVREETKTGSRSVTTLLGKELTSLRKWSKYQGDDDFVFAEQAGQCAGNPVRLQALREHWREVVRRQQARGLTRFDPDLYSLRHYFATERLAAGVPPVFVAKTLGHSLSELFRTYEHVMAETEEFQRTLWSEITPIELKEVGLQVVETDLE
ncbi:tyrosine-type recombinase/integrase [Synechococcus sp. AH-551-G03]|nr:tyrosine-type recombinase/integrase [Synechococcus sp. AH-551-G03]